METLEILNCENARDAIETAAQFNLYAIVTENGAYLAVKPEVLAGWSGYAHLGYCYDANGEEVIVTVPVD